MKKILAMLVAVLMLASVLAGCSGGEAAPAADAPAAEAAKRDDLVIQIGGEPMNMNVFENTTLLSVAVMNNVHATLVEGRDGEVVPELAKSWEWNEDFTDIVFTLDENAKFSDGSPVTPEDVVFTWKLMQEKGVKCTATYPYIDDIVAVGDNQVEIKLNTAFTPLLSNLEDSGFAVVSKAAYESDPEYNMTPKVVSGPYYVDEWLTGQSITLKANEYYVNGPVPIKTIKFLFMPDENNSMIALEAGEIDMMTGPSFSLSGSAVEYLRGVKGVQLLEYASTNYNYLILNQTLDQFKDINVRKAIDYALNRDDIIAVAVDGYGVPASIPVIEGMGGYAPGYEPVKQDIEKAKEYMAASAYPDGFSFQIDCPVSVWVKAGQVIQSELKEIGITVTLNETDIGTQVTNNAANNYEAFIWSFGNSTGDVSGIFLIYGPESAKNYARFTDPTIMDYLTAANALNGDERVEALKLGYDAIMEQTQYIPLYFPIAYQAASDNLNLIPDSVTATGLPLFYNMSWK